MSFYKMDPAKWDFGTAELSLEEEAAYLRIVNAIHKHEGPVPNNDRVLAGLFRSSTRKARALVEALEAAGKITIEGGKIWNDKARADLEQRGFASAARAESGSKGGKARAANEAVRNGSQPFRDHFDSRNDRETDVKHTRDESEVTAKSLESNEQPQANASSREEKRREEKKEKEEPIGSKKKNPPMAIQLPEFWVPSDRNIADATAKGFTESEIQNEADRFRDYHRAKGTAFRDWDAGWRTWLGNARKFGGGRMAGPSNPGNGGGRSSIASIVARRRLEAEQGLPFDT